MDGRVQCVGIQLVCRNLFQEQPSFNCPVAVCARRRGGTAAREAVPSTVAKGEKLMFVVELPPYRIPQWRTPARSTWGEGQGVHPEGRGGAADRLPCVGSPRLDDGDHIHRAAWTLACYVCKTRQGKCAACLLNKSCQTECADVAERLGSAQRPM